MSHRLNKWQERLTDHLDDRKWSEEDKRHFTHMVGRSALITPEGALAILEFQQATDERIEAEKQFDEAFVPQIPQDFFEQRFMQTESVPIERIPIIERPDAAQLSQTIGYDSEGTYIDRSW